MEHWDNAVLGAEVAAHNMVSDEAGRRPHLPAARLLVRPVRRQHQVRRRALVRRRDLFTQGSVKERRFAAVYGRRGRIVGAVTFNHAKWLEYYGAQIERSAPFPPPPGFDRTRRREAHPGRVPGAGAPTGSRRRP